MKHLIYCVWFALLTVTLSSGCKKQAIAESSSDYNIDVKQRSPASEFFDSYSYVRLETNDDALLADVKGIRVTDSIICVLSRGQIHSFDHAGRHIGTVDRKGQGPQEYADISDFRLQGNNIMVLAGRNNKIFEYDSEGNYVREIPLDNSYQSFEIYNDSLICLASGNMGDRGFNFVFINATDGSVISEFDKFDSREGFNLTGVHNIFLGRGSDGELLVSHPFDMTIYRLTESEMTPAFTLSFNTDDQLPAKYLEKSFMELSDATNNMPVVRYMTAYYKGKDFDIIAYPLFGDHGLLTDMVKIGNGRQTAYRPIAEEIDLEFPYVSKPMAIYNDCVVSVREPASIQYIEDHNGLTEFHDSGLSDSDNPVIFFHHIRP